MERMNLKYSLKNIAIPGKQKYLKAFISKVESLIRRMRWKAFYFENPAEDTQEIKQSNYGFKSGSSPPQNEKLAPFEDDMYNMIRRIEFKPVINKFQKQLKEDSQKINSSNKLIVSADKTTNLYKVDKEKYEELLVNNITKCHKKTNNDAIKEINKEAKKIAEKLKIDDKMKCYNNKEAFITLKDHKDGFETTPKCRLINPAKSEVGRVSKMILENINNRIQQATKANLWRSTSKVISWFNNIKQKRGYRFLKFDIVDFYPSISERLFDKCINFAKSKINVNNDDIKIIRHARKSLLFYKDSVWSKKGDETLFDVPQGSFDSAEICELVGLYLLDNLKTIIKNENIGLYRDDGLAVVKMSGQKTENIKKKIHKLFNENDLKITIEANLIKTDFLDATFDLSNNKFYPYRKPNDTPLYINVNSNHPPSIIKQIPKMINRRLSDLSCNADEFEKSKPEYQDALKKSGFKSELKYEYATRPKRHRKRNIIWFNPPFNLSVKSNIGKIFIQMISKHFPRHHKFSKIFNRNNIKLSYSCMDNMASVLQQHNKKIMNANQPNEHRPCNCRIKNNCPLNGNCCMKGIVYKAVVKSINEEKIYFGACETEFKFRFNNHTCSFKNAKRKNDTVLSKYIHSLIDKKIEYSITWDIEKRANPYRNGAKDCNLCLTEKYVIAMANQKNLLNKRTELISGCRHVNKFHLKNLKN